MKNRASCGLATLSAVLLASALWSRTLAARAEVDFPATGRFVAVEGLKLHVVEAGTGPAVVLLHGAFGGIQDWSATVLDDLARAHRTVAVDRPGHGWSERPASGALGPLEQARLVRSALREIGVERPILVGFSWGGAMALSWALAWPDEVAGVLVVNPAAYPWPGATSPAYLIAGQPLVGPLLARTFSFPIGALLAPAAVARAFHPDRVPDAFARAPIPLALRPAQFLAEAQDMRLLKPALAIQSPHYPGLRVPLGILAGREDRVTLAWFHSERLQREVPDAELTLVDGAGHQLLYTHPRELVAAVERLAARVEAR